MSLFGMDPMQFLTTRDQWRMNVMHAIAAEAARLRNEEHETLARHIANAVAKSFGGK